MEKINIVIRPLGDRTGLTVYSSMLVNNLKCPFELSSPTSMWLFRILSKIKYFSFLNGYYSTLDKNVRNKKLVHFTDQFLASLLFFHKIEAIVTVHDLAYLGHPNWWMEAKHLNFNFLDQIWYKLALNGLKKAKRIIAVSEFTKKEIINLLNYPKEKVDVIYEGVGEEFTYQNLKKEQNTILYVGSEEIRKNLPILLEAMSKVKKQIPDVKLVKIGKAMWPQAREQLKKQIKSLDLGNNVVFKDYVQDLTQEYNKAAVFVFPSLYEGFGLPVLEAMACGCPVICSNATSLPEVGGDAVLYFNPNNAEELAEKIIKVLNDSKLQEELRQKGLERAKEFTWEKTAQKTIEAYKKIK